MQSSGNFTEIYTECCGANKISAWTDKLELADIITSEPNTFDSTNSIDDIVIVVSPANSTNSSLSLLCNRRHISSYWA